MSEQMHDVLIVGAGFTGSALAVELLRRLPQGARIMMIGEPNATGHGLAYRTTTPDHLLNVRAGRMSMIAGDAGHFVRWLDRQKADGEGIDGIADEYVPRSEYGRYIRETLFGTIADMRHRIDVEVVEDTAVDLRSQPPGFAVRTASGKQYATRFVALCLGHRPAAFPLRPTQVAPAARRHMIAEPFTDYRMTTIAPDARILMIGTGLTMIDQVLRLAEAGHRGPIVAVSRHGFLPMAHLPRRTEPQAIPLPDGAAGLSALVRTVVAAARAETRAGRDWRAIVDGLRPVTADLWSRLGNADRKRFVRHVESFWSVHRHRMAPAISARIASLREEGRLSVVAGRVVAVRQAGTHVSAAIRRRSVGTVELQPFDWIINCSGMSQDRDDPLLARIFSRRFAQPDHLGRGIEVNRDSAPVDGRGAPVPGLFALGPPTAGTFLEITAVPDIREQCASVAEKIVGELAGNSAAARRLQGSG